MLRALGDTAGVCPQLVFVGDHGRDTVPELFRDFVPAPVGDKSSDLGLEAERPETGGTLVDVARNLVTSFGRHLAVEEVVDAMQRFPAVDVPAALVAIHASSIKYVSPYGAATKPRP